MNVAFFKTKYDIETASNKCIELLDTHSIVGFSLNMYSTTEILEIIKRIGNKSDIAVTYPSQKEFSTYNITEITPHEDDEFIYLLNTIKFIE